MPYILNIETATKNCSVALAKDGKTILCKEIAEIGFSHAEKLHVFIEEIIAEAGISINDLNAIAVSSGPGSYTGLRIGVSAAKGLSFSLNIPLISVDTLTSLANQVLFSDGFIIPMIDARRMEVYSAVFNSDKEIIRKVEAEILTENSFNEITEKIYFIGDSNEKAKAILTKPNFVFLDEIKYPSAKEMSSLSYKKFLGNSFEDVAYYEPYYLKDFMFAK
ncbi:tRNA (adenosine(37)-N6)-threonylcarbamoyltransferase complex dimerization subunit type 1 TsaB [Flavobacterium sp.]|uniref:tRNA (adenosine(37)-N6)-threonylcarbamoyltransferase complex dimerization subunit type 1 TsaB n=1 Tax=Flavobacterium sp. TaxID=239 RepID=UPI003750C20B